jgi:hypothetical protein
MAKYPLITLTFVGSAALLLAACGSSAPSSIQLGERTSVRIGLTGVDMAVQIERPGIYALFTEGQEDTVCSISDGSGREVAEDDDSGEDLNCLVNAVLAAGPHTVHVRGYDLTDRGQTHVTIERLPSQSAQPGEVLNLEIAEMRGQVLELDITRTGNYRLGTSGMFDTTCWLYDANGTEIDYNDDFGGDQNCGMIRQLATGNYMVLVRGFDGSAGQTTFLATPIEIRSVSLAPGARHVERLDHGEDRVDFEVEISEAGLYSFFTTGETDTYCELYDRDGTMLAYNDDGEDLNCFIQHALNAGWYRFNVSGYSSNTGDFTARVERR